jgi:hypothetical protein
MGGEGSLAMAGQQRKCANCRFFSDAGMPGNGWCTHPKRQLSSGVKLLVRAGELACRNSWGGDLFQSRIDDEAAAEPVAPADLPASGQDDEVTSVTIPSGRPQPREDRVVADRPAARRDAHDTNDAARRDQEERARIMARGSRDAVAHARQRFTSRNQPRPDSDVVAGDNVDQQEGADRVLTRQARFSDRGFASALPRIPTEPVPREEIAQRGEQDRFDTVPAIDPNFDLPGQRYRAEPVGPAPEPVPEAARDEVHLTTYEHVLQRARRIRASKQGARPIRHADLLLARDEAVDDRELIPAYAVPPAEAYDPEPAYDEMEPEQLEAEAWPDATAAQVPVFSAGEPDDDILDDLDAGEDTHQWPDASWADEDDELEDEPWDDSHAEWDDDNPTERAPRRHGWLNRIGFRRSNQIAHDDATVTRHAAAMLSYPEDEPYDDLDAGWAYEEPAIGTPWSEHHAADAELPAYRQSRHGSTWDAQISAPAPVPASERDHQWDDVVQPVRPAAPARHRSRLSAELPDLDDALFDGEDTLAARVERPQQEQDARSAAPMLPASSAAEALRSRSPRDSFFRSSRFTRDATASAHETRRAAVPRDVAPVEGATLPDLDSDRLDVRDVVARGGELLDRRIAVAPDIPRKCRTCRSFRSADGGTRGWCTNEWAFTHRRMVNDDDLACVSAVGCWWLPADHLRLDLDEDVDDAPTPRMDELIARNRPAARRASGE